jgi:orotate phosphoribosyltransferase
VNTERRARFIGELRARGYERRPEPFTLSSGGTSQDYVDCRRALADGTVLRLAGEVVADVIGEAGVEYDAVGGLTMGADPIAHAVALVTGHEWFSVRKEAKGHGQGRRVEGAEIGPGVRVVLVDDVITTGRAIIDACDAVLDAKADIVLAVTLLDRSGKADAALADRGVRHIPVATWTEFGIDRI